ncbi:MAG: response regulator [Candidatus Gygaella obscura]|nr:response regulator [Candidatus Gygaella obscura]
MKRIMIVDDEKDFCFFIKKNLELTKLFEVLVCIDAKEAFQKIKNEKPNLVILDVAMPDKDGSQIAQEIEEDEELKHLPFIFLTALVTEEEAKRQASQSKRQYIFSKPVEIQSLINTINKLLV